MLKDFSKDSFDIIIQAGQSNSEGTGFGNVEEPYQPKENVCYLNDDMTVSTATEVVFGNGIKGNFSLTFADEYIKNGLLSEGRKLLIIRSAVGGTGFMANHWKVGDCLYVKMIDMINTALSLNPNNRLVALLWHQGEDDAIRSASFQTHYDNLATLLNSVRSQYDAPALPFIAGDFVQEWKELNIGTVVLVSDAIRAVCRDYGGRFVETDGLVSNWQDSRRINLSDDQDKIHFSRRSIYELGRRYFDAFADIIK